MPKPDKFAQIEADIKRAIEWAKERKIPPVTEMKDGKIKKIFGLPVVEKL